VVRRKDRPADTTILPGYRDVAEIGGGAFATVYRATEEVEDAFTDLAQQEARAAALQRQIAALGVARDQAQQAYQEGVTSLVEVRDADRELLTASDQLEQTRADAARAAVAAYLALGGGWTPEATVLSLR
jgi:outer membrane protein TolC